MSNGTSSTTILTVPTYLPLPEAARKYDLSESVLTQLIHAGKIEAVQLPSGELLVPANNDSKKIRTKEQIITGKFAHLRGQQITVTEAAEKYNVERRNLLNWKNKGYITVLKPGYQMELDEAEVAYCVEVFRKQQESGIKYGTPLLDENGLPYKLKHPDLSKRRRDGN